MVFTTRKYNSSTKKLTFPPKGTKSPVGSHICKHVFFYQVNLLPVVNGIYRRTDIASLLLAIKLLAMQHSKYQAYNRNFIMLNISLANLLYLSQYFFPVCKISPLDFCKLSYATPIVMT